MTAEPFGHVESVPSLLCVTGKETFLRGSKPKVKVQGP